MNDAASVFAAVASTIIPTWALGKEITFQFDVNSSGPEIYPCDAGLTRESKVDNTAFCHFKGTTKECDASQVGQIANKDSTARSLLATDIFDNQSVHACVCTGNAGSFLLDYMVGVVSRYTGEGSAQYNHGGWGPPQLFTIAGYPWQYTKSGDDCDNAPLLGTRANAASHLSVAHFGQSYSSCDHKTPLKKQFTTQIERLSFNFGSEHYGNEYYVDLCYRGPQIDWPSFPDAQAKLPHYNISAWLGYTDLSAVSTCSPCSIPNPNRSYLNLAKPIVRAKLICEMQDPQSQNHMAPSEYFTFYHMAENINLWPLLESLDTNSSVGPIGTESPVAILEYPPSRVTAGVTNIFSATTPRGIRWCKMRYLFEEARTDHACATNKNNSAKDTCPPFLCVPYERAWQRNDGRFFVKLSIEDPL